MWCALPADRSTMEVEGVGFLKILQASRPTDGGHFGNSHGRGPCVASIARRKLEKSPIVIAFTMVISVATREDSA
jgi:hypothetical protein